MCNSPLVLPGSFYRHPQHTVHLAQPCLFGVAEHGAKTLVIDKVTSGGIRDDLGAINSRYAAMWHRQTESSAAIAKRTSAIPKTDG